jgi:type IV secretory pathway protease TraF
VILLVALVAVRLPSLVEPFGADQALYAYIGQRINAGDVPYRDAWDQKPPAIHFIYAALWRVWPHESVVAAADLAAAACVAWLLVVLGRRTFGTTAGFAAASLFLLFGNPAIQRLSGVRVRGQCETFIAVAVAAAMVLAARRKQSHVFLHLAGVCLALAFWLKYNAGVYVLPVAALAWINAGGIRAVMAIGVGFAAVSAVFLSYFAANGALTDLRLATIAYNLQYSGETYEGFRGVVDYLLFPITRARLDLLWYLGGIGVVLIVIKERLTARTWMVIGWLAAACVSIMINGARNLPQYFMQAQPALAFAAGAGLWLAWTRGPRSLRIAVIAAAALGLWRVGDEAMPIRLGGLPEVARNARFDLDYARGRIGRDVYLARFQEQTDAKYVPLSAERLTARVRDTTAPTDRILVFGLAASAYVNAPRQSASRFFWSQPVVAEFGRGLPGYGSAGLLEDLQRTVPALIALQKKWGDPGPQAFFLNTPPLRAWLDASYVLEEDGPDFTIWRRRS